MTGGRIRGARWLIATLAFVALTVAGSSVALAAVGSTPSTRTTNAAAPACATAGLVVWLNTTGNGAAGSFYYTLEFTNLSGHACTLSGYPGVSAVNLAGQQVGAAAARDTTVKVRTVTVRQGQSATVQLRLTDTGAFPTSTCGQVTAAGLRVYPPNQRASKVVPFPLGACSKRTDQFLSIQPIGTSSAS